MPKKLKIPIRYLVISKDKGTVATRGIRGRFTGRKAVRNGDDTRARHVSKDIDINKDGKIDFYGGTILGRSQAIRGNSRSRGTIRRNIM